MSEHDEASWEKQLERGLEAGFELQSRGDSVIDRIKEMSGITPRVLLRDAPTYDSPIVNASSRTDGAGRYQVLGEIARGGVGVVFKGRDIDLGRDVAMKVIRPEYARNDEVLQRFVEEAQIGGQLQHPGMVPVYEFGLGEDQRAYFTMKLIKGQTLAGMLRGRESPAHDRRRFLAIYEQICQTVAYAHSRGVVHRDLKPANVMVGAFGEVQVVDWGFAKVLARATPSEPQERVDVTEVRTVRTGSTGSESRMGSVMGTPAFMPPEQALGQVDLVDERSDVFSLGAVLTEVLTGAPPYRKDAHEIFVQAAQADLEDAFARLDASDADDALKQLAKACLAKDRDDRPAHAGEVADAVSRHLASVEERAREAEIEAAEAQVRATGERRARKLTVGLAAAILLCIVFGGGSYWWMEKEKRARATKAAKVVDSALDEARAARSSARADPLRNLAEWNAAVVAAREALALARDADDATREMVDAFAMELIDESDRWHYNHDLLKRMEQVRLQRGEDFDLQRADAEYVAAFGGLIEPDEPETSAERIRGTGIADHLAPALDEWNWVRGQLGRSRTELVEIADTVDPDGWRTQLRRAGIARDKDELLRLAANLGDAAYDGSTPFLAGLYLAAAGAHDEALTILRNAQRRRPGDFWLSYQLAHELTRSDPPQWQESVSFFSAALAARPESVEVRRRIGIAYQKLEQYDYALDAFHAALEKQEGFLRAYGHILEIHEARGELDRVIEIATELATREPRDALAHARLGHAYAISGKWPEAQQAYAKAVELDPKNTALRVYQADSHLHANEWDKAEAILKEAVQGDPESASAQMGLGRAFQAQRQWRPAIAQYEKGTRLQPDEPENHRLLAQVRFFAGDVKGSEAACREALRLEPTYAPAHFQISHALKRQGEIDRAIEHMELGLKHRAHQAKGRWQTWFWRKIGPGGQPDKLRTVQGWDSNVPVQYYTLATFQLARGNLDGAVECLRELIASYPEKKSPRLVFQEMRAQGFLALLSRLTGDLADSERLARSVVDRNANWTMAYLDLAHVQLARGEGEEALANLMTYHTRYRFTEPWVIPAEDWERDAKRLVELAPRLADVLAGKAEVSGRDRVLLANYCFGIGRFVASVRLYQAAFAQNAELGAEYQPLYAGGPFRNYSGGADAAFRAAWMTGAADNDSLSDLERAELRKLAREWMRRDVAVWRKGLGDERTRARAAGFYRGITSWQINHFSLFREKSNLEKLSAEEQKAFKEVWAEVLALAAEVRPEK